MSRLEGPLLQANMGQESSSIALSTTRPGDRARVRLRVRLWLIPAVFYFLILMGCGVLVRGGYDLYTEIRNSELFYQGRHGELTDKEQEWAKTAWKYFETNYNSETGLVNSVDGFPSTTMWHIGDYLAALVSARELNLLPPDQFDNRLSQILLFLNTMDLFAGRVPHKIYHTQTGKMVTYANTPGEIGWSAVDLGRLMIWLRIIREQYPYFGEYIDKSMLRCNFCDVIDRCGTLYGGVKDGSSVKLIQEGRLGYEEYAALGFKGWGFDTRQASKLEPYTPTKVYGIEIWHDGRDPREFGALAPVVSLPFLLYGLEFTWQSSDLSTSSSSHHHDRAMADLAQRIYEVQETRYRLEGILTARTDHQLSRPPYFVHDTIFGLGYPWATFSDTGAFYPEYSLVSTRAVFGMWALWKNEYTDLLMSSVEFLRSPARGWYEGRFEKSGGYEPVLTSTTNALVLEALLYKTRGRIFKAQTDLSYYQALLADTFKWPGKCFPPERQQCEQT